MHSLSGAWIACDAGELTLRLVKIQRLAPYAFRPEQMKVKQKKSLSTLKEASLPPLRTFPDPAMTLPRPFHEPFPRPLHEPSPTLPRPFLDPSGSWLL